MIGPRRWLWVVSDELERRRAAESSVRTRRVRLVVDRRASAEYTAMRVATGFETQRGADITDVSLLGTRAIEPVIRGRGVAPNPPCSADLLSVLGGELRVIEVKGRGGRGPVTITESQLLTFQACGSLSWLYVVWNATQPEPEELWAIQDPGRLDWTYSQGVLRSRQIKFRLSDEAKFTVACANIEQHGSQVWVADAV